MTLESGNHMASYAGSLGTARFLFRLEVQSGSTRITFCFDSNHSLFRLESQSVSTRITVCLCLKVTAVHAF